MEEVWNHQDSSSSVTGQEVTKNPTATLTAEIGEPTILIQIQNALLAQQDTAYVAKATKQSHTISAALHKSGLNSGVARQRPLFSKRHITAHLEFAKRYSKDWEHEEKDSLTLLAELQELCLTNKALLITWLIPSLQWAMVVAASCLLVLHSGRDRETGQN